MIGTKDALIKKLKDIGEKKIEEGILFKSLALSIEKRKDEKRLKEWKEDCKEVLGL